MIEKLSDTTIKSMIDLNNDLSKDRLGDENGGFTQDTIAGMEWGMREARDYYDAQIDEQAKTMEELVELCVKTGEQGIEEQDREFSEICTGSHNNHGSIMFLNGFLAAGGTIKDGE